MKNKIVDDVVFLRKGMKSRTIVLRGGLWYCRVTPNRVTKGIAGKRRTGIIDRIEKTKTNKEHAWLKYVHVSR